MCWDGHHADCSSPQERQRLETILNLCAEYTKTDGTEPADVHQLLAADAGWRAPRGAMALGRAAEEPVVLRQRESLERSDEENLKEECSSTESTHHEVSRQPHYAVPHCAVPRHATLCCAAPCCAAPCHAALCCAVPCRAHLPSLQHEELAGPRAKEAQQLEGERAGVLGRLDQLKSRLKELEQQLQETSREVRGPGVLTCPPRSLPSGPGQRPDAAVLGRRSWSGRCCRASGRWRRRGCGRSRRQRSSCTRSSAAWTPASAGSATR